MFLFLSNYYFSAFFSLYQGNILRTNLTRITLLSFQKLASYSTLYRFSWILAVSNCRIYALIIQSDLPIFLAFLYLFILWEFESILFCFLLNLYLFLLTSLLSIIPFHAPNFRIPCLLFVTYLRLYYFRISETSIESFIVRVYKHHNRSVTTLCAILCSANRCYFILTLYFTLCYVVSSLDHFEIWLTHRNGFIKAFSDDPESLHRGL